MIVDGKQIATEVLARTHARIAALGRPVVLRAISVEPTPATLSYLRIKASQATKAGITFEQLAFGRESSAQVRRALQEASKNADALIVQLPLPDGFNQQAICDTIAHEQDADVLSSAARAAFLRGDADALLPPVVGAVQEILSRQAVQLKGKRALVIGQGYLVGAPVSAWLQQQGCLVTRADRTTTDLASLVRSAELIVSGAGVPKLITPDQLDGAPMLIDAGTSESGGAIVGDADPACAEHCALFTPVPGGVGPIAVAKLFENAAFLAERKVSFS